MGTANGAKQAHRSAVQIVPAHGAGANEASAQTKLVKRQVISRRSTSQDAEALFPAQVSSVSCSGMTLHLGTVSIILLALIGRGYVSTEAGTEAGTD
jgi:hypothetical protein